MSDSAHPKTLVMIPALNEADSIAHVIGQIREHVPWADVAVINDGSTDDTARIARECGAVVLMQPYNVGIGTAVQTALMYADRHGYSVAVQNDGDGQHNPAEIPLLLQALTETDADLVVGSRYIEDRGYITPWQRKIGINILAKVISLLLRQKFTDPTSGFRASNRQVIEFCANNYPFDYPEPEAIVLLTRAGFKVREIPVTMNPRYGGISSITPFRSAYYMVKVILAIFIDMLRKSPKTAQTKKDSS